jgi:hypothetical protein
MLCKNPNFWQWVNEEGGRGGIVENEADATEWLRDYLDIQSRGELDRNQERAGLFRSDIQTPFSTWLGPQH